MVPTKSSRHPAVSELLLTAKEGNAQAVGSLVSYLSSNSADLRHMIQLALHDSADAQDWRFLLRLMAVHKWGLGLTGRLDIASQIPTDQAALLRMEQTIAEVFVLDEQPNEAATKEDVLHLGLADTDPRIRWTAAYLLGLRGADESIPHLRDMLERGALPERMRAVEALANVRREESAFVLILALEMRGTPMHHAAWRSLNDLGKLAAPALTQALEHQDEHIRWHAARALGQIGDTRAIETLATGLCDENPAVRWASARALGGLDALAVPAILEQIARCRLDEPMRQAALHALNSMPSRQTLEYLRPLLDALNSPAAYILAPQEAQRLLTDWKVPV